MSRKVLFPLLVVTLIAAFALAPCAALAVTERATLSVDAQAVDADAHFKGFSGAQAEAEIAQATQVAADELAAAEAIDDGTLAVGDVRPLYADGEWRDFTLRAIGGNAEIWVANDLSYPDSRPVPVVTQAQVDYLFNEFNAKIYPGNTKYFGFNTDRDGTKGEWAAEGKTWYITDNPQRMMILVFNIIDEQYLDPTFPTYVAGYYWPYGTKIKADRNMIHIDCRDWANRIGPNGSRPYLYEQVFTHEFEHAIHGDHDPDETSWVDEGMADLAPYLIGYGHSRSHIADYLEYHRAPLTVWGGELLDYGKSYLFQLYLLENFGGPNFVKHLVDEQANGIEGVQASIAAMGSSAKFDDVFRDWTVANYLDNPSLTGVSGASLGYFGLDIPSADTNSMSIQQGIKEYGSKYRGELPFNRYYSKGVNELTHMEWVNGMTYPYSPNYRTFAGISPELDSKFLGDNTCGLPAYQGQWELWGNRADMINTRATLAAPVTLGTNAKLKFMVNYDIEEAWDYAFVQISTDGGLTWTSLANADTRTVLDPEAHPNVVKNVPGFTGSNGGWMPETFDLAAYSGESVLLRFLYITDWGTTGEGFYADNVEIVDDSGTIFSDDLEASGDKWVFTGFLEDETTPSQVTALRTTGVVQNQWSLTFVNPRFAGNNLTYQFTDKTAYVAPPNANGIVYQRDYTAINTLNLNSGEVCAIISNHLPEDTSYQAFWQMYGVKGDANAKK